jgi:hypothetical protein
MGSRSEIEDVVLALGRPGSIGGMVVDGRGEPQRLVSVAAYDGESRVEEAVTDDGGRYRIDGLRAGDYLVLPLGRDTHGFSSRDGATDLDGIGSPREFFERPVRVESGAVTRVDLDTDRDSLGALEGVVSPPREGMVVRCACVVEGRPRLSPPFGRKTRVEKGRFAFSHLLPGEYRIWLEAHDDLAPPGFDGAATEGVHGAEATAWIHRARTTRVELRGPEE